MSNTYDTDNSADGSITIFETSKNYISGTIVVYDVTSGSPVLVTNTVREIGGTYLEVTPAPDTGTILRITYEVYEVVPDNQEAAFTLIQRVKDLEIAVENLYKLNKVLEESISNRVNITSFQAWLRLVEKKLGIKIIDQGLGVISNQLGPSVGL